MRRVLVVGTSGSGKSTLAAQIAEKLSLPFHATDPFYWSSGWVPVSNDQVEARLAEVLATDAWVMDGNFEQQWQAVWPRADCVVWLDYSLARVVWQVTQRNLTWWVGRQEAWSGGRMTLGRALSGIRHAVRTHAAKRGRYPAFISQLKGVTVHRFGRPFQAAAWVRTLR